MKEKIQLSSIKNIIFKSKIISKNDKQYNSRALPRNLCQSPLEFRAFPRTPLLLPRFLSRPYFKMLGCRSRADVATTWPRRDVAVTSMLYSSLLPKTASTAALFSPSYLYPKQTPNEESKHKNYIINIK